MPIVHQMHNWHCAACTNGIVRTIGIVCINGIVKHAQMALSAKMAFSYRTNGIVRAKLAFDVTSPNLTVDWQLIDQRLSPLA